MDTDDEWEIISHPIPEPHQKSNEAHRYWEVITQREHRILNELWSLVYANARSKRMVGILMSIACAWSFWLSLQSNRADSTPILAVMLFLTIYVSVDGHYEMQDVLRRESYYRKTGIIRRRKKRWWRIL